MFNNQDFSSLIYMTINFASSSGVVRKSLVTVKILEEGNSLEFNCSNDKV